MDLKALPLVVVEKGSNFRVPDETMQFLQSIKRPVAVVSIAGAYRSGKSFLLNRLLLNRFSGFETASTIHACTKGLWVWNQPIDLVTSDGQEVALLVVDSEGLGDTKEDANHDTRIYMLAMLLSSLFIYNGKTAIDEQSLSTMSLMLELCKNLQVHSDSADDLANYFPSLLWVIRDFSLKLEMEDGSDMSMNRYLSNSLEDQKGTSNSVETKNRARRLIKYFFKERDCFGLIRPTDDERVLQLMSSDAQLRPEFLSQLAELNGLVMKKIRPKAMKGRLVTGEILGNLAISYTSAMSQGGVPNIQSAWTNVCAAENQKLVTEAECNYEALIEQELGSDMTNEDELKAKHASIKETLIAAMKLKAVGSMAEIEPFLAKARVKIKERFTELKRKNARSIAAKCESQLKSFREDAFAKLKRGEYAHQADFTKDLELFISEMKKTTPLSPQAELKIRDMTEKMTLEAADYIHRMSEVEKNNETRRLTEAVSQLQSQLLQRKEEWMREKESLADRLQDGEKERHTAKAQVVALNARVEDLTRDRQRAEENFKEQLAQLREDNRERLDDIKHRLQESQQTVSDLSKTSAQDISDLKRDLLLARQELDYRSKECDELKRKRTDLEDDARAARAEIARLKGIIEDLEGELRKARKEIEGRPVRVEGGDAPGDWVAERTHLKGQIEVLKGQLTERQSVQDVLMTALQSSRSEAPRHTEKALETAAGLTASLERTEKRCALLQEKVERLKPFKKMITNCSNLQCRSCSKTLATSVFSTHIGTCLKEAGRTAAVAATPISITITQTTVKEGKGEGGKSYTEYLISVGLKNKMWTVTRKYKDFSLLNEQLETSYPHIEMPEVSQMFRHQSISLVMSNSKPKSMDERRKLLQMYLMNLAAIPTVRDSAIFNQFISADLYFPEEYRSSSPRRSGEEDTTLPSTRYQHNSMEQSPGGSDLDFGY